MKKNIPLGCKRDENCNHDLLYKEILDKTCKCVKNCFSKFNIEKITEIRKMYLLNKNYNEIEAVLSDI